VAVLVPVLLLLVVALLLVLVMRMLTVRPHWVWRPLP